MALEEDEMTIDMTGTGHLKRYLALKEEQRRLEQEADDFQRQIYKKEREIENLRDSIAETNACLKDIFEQIHRLEAEAS